jgi:hypothetical protein
MKVKIDVGIRSAKDFNSEQKLPEGEFADYLNYAIIEETINLEEARKTLYKFSNRDKIGKIISDPRKMTPYNPIH